MKTKNPLTSKNLKNTLWETLNEIKDGELEPSKGSAIAYQAREIVRTINTELRILDKIGAKTTKQLKDFTK